MKYIKNITSYKTTNKIIAKYINIGFDVDVMEGSLIDNFIIYDVDISDNGIIWKNIVILESYVNPWNSKHTMYFTNKDLNDIIKYREAL